MLPHVDQTSEPNRVVTLEACAELVCAEGEGRTSSAFNTQSSICGCREAVSDQTKVTAKQTAQHINLRVCVVCVILFPFSTYQY